MPHLVISGVNRGIGEGVASAALAAGWTVTGVGRSDPHWATDKPAGFRFLTADMAYPGMVQQACAMISEPVDVLFCSAATFGPQAFHLHDFEPEAFAQAFTVNAVSPLVMARALRHNLDAGSKKLIVMMSTGNASLSGNTQGSMLAYRTSKSALNQAVRNLAAEWGPAGLTTIALNPGWVRTEMGGPSAPLSVQDASEQILTFLTQVATPALNGGFVNTDGSPLPW
jgi:NAD(P)-dependent dehydrogenase (short-subunit alcohol dehydrogenase family)